jgi:hypothetical protein
MTHPDSAAGAQERLHSGHQAARRPVDHDLLPFSEVDEGLAVGDEHQPRVGHVFFDQTAKLPRSRFRRVFLGLPPPPLLDRFVQALDQTPDVRREIAGRLLTVHRPAKQRGEAGSGPSARHSGDEPEEDACQSARRDRSSDRKLGDGSAATRDQSTILDDHQVAPVRKAVPRNEELLGAEHRVQARSGGRCPPDRRGSAVDPPFQCGARELRLRAAADEQSMDALVSGHRLESCGHFRGGRIGEERCDETCIAGQVASLPVADAAAEPEEGGDEKESRGNGQHGDDDAFIASHWSCSSFGVVLRWVVSHMKTTLRNTRHRTLPERSHPLGIGRPFRESGPAARSGS